MKKHGSKKTQSFTLIELLIVVGIISILLGITAPAFRRLLVGNSVDTGARMVSSQLMLARAEAIARRTYVAVIMPAVRTGVTEINVAADDEQIYNRKAFRSAYVEKDGDDYKIKEWVPGTQWSFLPEGAVIAAVENTNVSRVVWNSTENEYQLKNSSDDERDWYQEADDGGSKVNGSTADSDHPDLILGGNSNVRAIVFKPNGRIESKTWVTVMEGNSFNNEDNLIERGNKDNIRVMEITPFTGMVRYIF